MPSLRFFPVALLLTACATQVGSVEPAKELPTFKPSQFQDWPSEHIELPPGFAPDMPSGEEFLLFAPGMFNPEAEDFWSYVFVMQVDRVNLDAEGIDELLELYYDGLIQAVAGGKGEDVGSDSADVRVSSIGEGRYEAEVHLIDAFKTMKPLDLRVLIQLEADGEETSFLRIQASPQVPEHELWRELSYLARTMELSGLNSADKEIVRDDSVAP